MRFTAAQRHEVVKLSETMTNREIADRFGKCEKTIVRVLGKMRRLGVPMPKRSRHYLYKWYNHKSEITNNPKQHENDGKVQGQVQ